MIFANMTELRNARLRQGLTLRGLGELTGLTERTILRVEQGKAVRPSTAQKLCSALSCSFDELFDIREGAGWAE